MWVAHLLWPNLAVISFIVVLAAAQHIISVFSSRENCFALGILVLRSFEVEKQPAKKKCTNFEDL
jgi:hypothetical protein